MRNFHTKWIHNNNQVEFPTNYWYRNRPNPTELLDDWLALLTNVDRAGIVSSRSLPSILWVAPLSQTSPTTWQTRQPVIISLLRPSSSRMQATPTSTTRTRLWPTSTACERSAPRRTVGRLAIGRPRAPSGMWCRSTTRCFAPSRSVEVVEVNSSHLRLLVLPLSPPFNAFISHYCCCWSL